MSVIWHPQIMFFKLQLLWLITPTQIGRALGFHKIEYSRTSRFIKNKSKLTA
jgi:hypothetical protein